MPGTIACRGRRNPVALTRYPDHAERAYMDQTKRVLGRQFLAGILPAQDQLSR